MTGASRATAPVCKGGYRPYGADLVTALDLGQRAVELAPDPLASAVVCSAVGEAYIASGESGKARTQLGRALDVFGPSCLPQLECWTLCRLGDVELLDNRSGAARVHANKALALTEAVTFPLGRGLALRALGRAEEADRQLGDARVHLLEALQVFTSIEARFEVARTHLDLASLFHLQHDREGAKRHLDEARGLFETLEVPRYVERSDAIAREYAGPMGA